MKIEILIKHPCSFTISSFSELFSTDVELQITVVASTNYLEMEKNIVQQIRVSQQNKIKLKD